MEKRWAIPLALSKSYNTFIVRSASKYHYFKDDKTSMCEKYDLTLNKVIYFDGSDEEVDKLHKDGLVCKSCFRKLTTLQNNIKIIQNDDAFKNSIDSSHARLKSMLGKVVKHVSGREYLVFGVSTHTETREKLVIYKALYKDSTYRAKPIDLFLREVDLKKYPNAKQKYVYELMRT